MSRTKVAVLGGGCAGVATAFHLSRTPALRRRFDVTLFQMGHRLGGKGATGRDPARANRIEEHGLHIWLGFYARAFGMMKECFDALEPLPRSPLQTIEDAFEPAFRISFSERGTDGAPNVWNVTLPPRPGLPWEPARSVFHETTVGSLSLFTSTRIWRQLLEDATQEPSVTLRRAGTMARLVSVVIRGLMSDALPKRSFEPLDDCDLRDWLRHHGADEALANAPVVNAIYDLAFAYPDGVSGPGRGNIAAGPALKAMLRIAFAYRGAPLWRMRYGMGDTIFAPLHRLLRERGVRFRFFHRVEGLHLDESCRRIETITVREQARLRGIDYAPLVDVAGLPCWPKQPLVAQLENVDADVDFEDPGCQRGRPRRLHRGRDFDEVVLAIPAPALRSMTTELCAASPRFARMVESSRSVATCAAQLWLRPSLEQLGWSHGPTVLTSHRRPFSSWGDMSDVLDAETWGHAPPRTLGYFCDVCDDHVDRPALKEAAERWLDDTVSALWPGSRHPDGTFDRRQLALAPGREGLDPVDEQYLRVNASPTERYVLTPAGSVRHRLWPGESGFSNLYLAGDWTRSSIDGGSVEAAVESGESAAHSLIERATERRVRSERPVEPPTSLLRG